MFKKKVMIPVIFLIYSFTEYAKILSDEWVKILKTEFNKMTETCFRAPRIEDIGKCAELSGASTLFSDVSESSEASPELYALHY